MLRDRVPWSQPHRLCARLYKLIGKCISCRLMDPACICFGITEIPVAMRLWETPVPIPNTKVKTQTADGTMLGTAWESRWVPDNGGIAQLGEHLPCKQGVMSSNLTVSTGRTAEAANPKDKHRTLKTEH